MKLRHPGLIRLAGLFGSAVVRLWTASLRYRLHPEAKKLDPARPLNGKRYIYAFWHEAMLFAAGMRSRLPIRILISRSADGELIAQICQHLGYGVVRGSTRRGGVEAIRQLVDEDGCHFVVTPDGPRGPRRRVQPGLVYLASRTGLPIVPVGIGFQRAWRARSWDRFAVPWPGTTATCVAAAPVHVPPDLNRRQLDHYRKLVEEQMLHSTAAAEEWARKAA